MPALDDDREERFCQEVAAGNSQTQAYLNAGYTAKNNVVAATQSSKLLRTRSYLSERIGELRLAARTQLANTEFVATVEHLTKLLLEDRLQAKEIGQPSAAVSAIKEVARLHGLGGEAITLKGDPKNPVVTVVERRIVDPAAPDS